MLVQYTRVVRVWWSTNIVNIAGYQKLHAIMNEWMIFGNSIVYYCMYGYLSTTCIVNL